MTADLRRLVKKCEDALKTLVCTRGKEITKRNIKTECLCREGNISPMCSAYPTKSLVIPWWVWGLMGDLITHAQF